MYLHPFPIAYLNLSNSISISSAAGIENTKNRNIHQKYNEKYFFLHSKRNIKKDKTKNWYKILQFRTSIWYLNKIPLLRTTPFSNNKMLKWQIGTAEIRSMVMHYQISSFMDPSKTKNEQKR